MRTRTFRGRTMAEALDQLKRHFGRDAVILSTRTLTRGGLLGLGRKPHVEITGAHGGSGLPRLRRRTTLAGGSGSSDNAEGAAGSVPLISKAGCSQSSDAVLTEIGTLKSLVHDLVREARRSREGGIPEALFDTYLALVQNEVGEKIARDLVSRAQAELTSAQLGDPKVVSAHLAAAVESMLPTAGPIRLQPVGKPTIIALIGPTGVGKTTTIAKLAANYSLREHRKVGLITIDTYRIAAVEQLKTYADIIDVPLEVVMSPDQLRDAVARMADRDAIFIDTAGRSQRDTIKIRELNGYFAAVRPNEIHLVLSATCSREVLTETVQRFSEVGVDRVIFTKLDEAIGFGVILACLDKASAQLSYVTTGQDVPDDIAVGEGKTLAKFILGERLPESLGAATGL